MPEDAQNGNPDDKLTLSQRLSSTFLKPAKTKPDPEEPSRPLTDTELAAKIREVDPIERKIGYAAAALGVLVAVLSTWQYVTNPKKTYKLTVGAQGNHCPTGYARTPPTGHTFQCVTYGHHSEIYWLGLMLVMLVFSLAILVTTWIGRRGAVGFASLMTGFVFTNQVGILGLPFLVFGGWLLLRAYRVQKYGTLDAKEAADAAAAKRAERRAGGTSSGGSSSGKKGTTSASSTGSRKPEPSKRYTPKAAPKKKNT